MMTTKHQRGSWDVRALALGLVVLAAACAQGQQLAGDKLVLEASSAKVAASTGNTAQAFAMRRQGVLFQLDVTAAATEAGDTLDVFVQTTIDGTNWVDVVHFTQVVGNGGAKRYFAKCTSDLAEPMFENSAALAAGSVRNMIGTAYRCRWAMNDATTVGNISFTFSVTMSGGILSGGQ